MPIFYFPQFSWKPNRGFDSVTCKVSFYFSICVLIVVEWLYEVWGEPIENPICVLIVVEWL